jgi:uncharacterized delta-60 repeat protein
MSARTAIVLAAALALPAAALAAAGDLDPTFGQAGSVRTLGGRALALQPDGRIVVASASGRGELVLRRYAPDGTPDPGFGAGGVVTTIAALRGVVDLAVDDAGRIVVATESALARYLPDGRLDPTFGTGGIAPSTMWISALALDPAGGIVVAGRVSIGIGGYCTTHLAVARHDPDGRPSASFGDGGTVVVSNRFVCSRDAFGVAVQDDGAIVVAGATDGEGTLVRLEPDGAVDAGFGVGGVVTTPAIGALLAVALAPDGAIVVFGRTVACFDCFQAALARFRHDGTLDPSFGAGGVAIRSSSRPAVDWGAVALQPDGKILTASRELARHGADGTLDCGFGIGGTVLTVLEDEDVGALDEGAIDVALQPDGAILALSHRDTLARYLGAGGEPRCGDCAVDPGEECDDGNRDDRDACSLACRLSVCGDGRVQLGERCDDGAANGAPGSCCTAACAFVEDGSPCDDGDLCTAPDTCWAGACESGGRVACAACERCDPAAGCHPQPAPLCRRPKGAGASLLRFTNRASDRSDRLEWHWRKGAETFPAAFGDPLTRDRYTLCAYELGGASPRVALSAVAPADGGCGKRRSCWKRTRRGRWFYDDDRATFDGLTRIALRVGLDGRAHVAVRGAGPRLRLPAAPLATPLLVQLQSDHAACWEAEYGADGVELNDGAQFKATDR